MPDLCDRVTRGLAGPGATALGVAALLLLAGCSSSVSPTPVPTAPPTDAPEPSATTSATEAPEAPAATRAPETTPLVVLHTNDNYGEARECG